MFRSTFRCPRDEARRMCAEATVADDRSGVFDRGNNLNATASAQHVLLLATQYALAYRGLRCFHAAGLKVSVIGTRQSKALAASRFVNQFILAKSEFVAANAEPLF